MAHVKVSLFCSLQDIQLDRLLLLVWFPLFLIKSLSVRFILTIAGIEDPDHPFSGERPRFGLIPAGSTDAIVIW